MVAGSPDRRRHGERHRGCGRALRGCAPRCTTGSIAPPPVDLDPRLVLAELSETERRVFEGVALELGFEPDDVLLLPPLRSVVELLAVGRMATRVPGTYSVTDRRRIAAESLGLEDDPERDSPHHPADSQARLLHRWHERIEAAGQNVRPSEEDAA